MGKGQSAGFELELEFHNKLRFCSLKVFNTIMAGQCKRTISKQTGAGGILTKVSFLHLSQ